MMKTIPYILLIALVIVSCSDDENDAQPGSEPVLMDLSGVSQKGPFVIGSSITIQELNESFSPNGTSFQVATSNNLGAFALNTEISTAFVEIICTGFYFNEVAGGVTNSNLTVRSITPVAEDLSSNINILTTLAKKRIIHLINETGLSYEEAKIQAEREVLLIFNISSETIEGFDQMDISGTGEDNAALLAISIMLQGEGSVADLSTLTSSIIEDLETDGILDDGNLREQIFQNASAVTLPEVRSNLISRYAELGLSIDVPDFEVFVNNVYENMPPVVSINNPADGTTLKQGEIIVIDINATDVDGEIREIQLLLNDSIVSNSTLFSFLLESSESPQYIRAMAIDDDVASTIDSIGFFVSPNEPPSIEITSPDDDVTYIEGENVTIDVTFSDPENTVAFVRFFIDEEEYQSFGTNNDTELTTEWTAEGAGRRYIIAEAEDEFGDLDRDSIQVNIIPNQAPTINFVSYSDGDEVEYGENEISVEASDTDGWIKRINWYLDGEFVDGSMDNFNEESTLSVSGVFNIRNTNSMQTLTVEVIDNLDDSTTQSISLNLKPGGLWEEVGQMNSIEITQAFADNDFFYIRSTKTIYRSSDGLSLTEIIDFDIPDYGTGDVYVLEEIHDGKIWVIQNDDDDLLETVIWTSNDQGTTWESFTTDYLLIFELFTFNNNLYAIDDNNFIHQLENNSWTLIEGTNLPWYNDPLFFEFNFLEFQNQAFAIDKNTSESRIWYSSDLSSWTGNRLVNEDLFLRRFAIVHSDLLWIFISDGRAFRSNDGMNWEGISTFSNDALNYQAILEKNGSLFLYSTTGTGALYRLSTFGL